jgi:hypothetical protein
MREIKFRGKRTDADEWVEGYLIYSGTIRIYEDGFHDYGVIPATVGQFTGLKDKNGKEIWEGDIVKCAAYPTLIFPVQYNHGGFNAGDHIACKLNVIGNIHDNPELLQS